MARARFYAGVFLITSSTLMLQLIETRIFSVVTWYQLAFFCISIAMFGMTAGAVFVFLRGDRFSTATLSHDLSYFSAAFAVTTAISLAVQLTLSPVLAVAVTALVLWIELSLCLSAPFFCSGVVVALALTRSPYPVGRVYGVDLLGAAAGCLGVLGLLSFTDGPSAVLWVGAAGAGASFLFARSGIGGAPPGAPFAWILGRPGAILVVLVVAAVANSLTLHGIQPVFVKEGIDRRGPGIDFESWNSFSRIAAGKNRIATPRLWGPSPTLPKDLRVDQRDMSIDAGCGTPMYRFTGDEEAVGFVKYDITNLAYFLPDRDRTAVIGVGGGRDILSAWVFGRRDVTGVEVNPIFIELLTGDGRYADYAGLDALDGVRFEVDEARSWFARSEESFDTIQMSLIDTFAATGAGAYSLSENGLYTVQGWRIFLQRLSPNGVFTVSRWYAQGEANETGRMLSLAVAALFELGVQDPEQNIFVALASGAPVATLIVSRTALSSRDLDTLHAAAATYEHEILVSPRAPVRSDDLGEIMASRDRQELEAFTTREDLTLDLSPPTDDRPFFFNQVPFNKPLQIWRLLTTPRERGIVTGNLMAAGTLIVILLVSTLMVLATIVIPLRPAIRDVGTRLSVSGTIYFLALGLGFMSVEIGLLQRMSVFLGHPMYSLSVVLFSLILMTGLGSLLSDRFESVRPLPFVIWVLLLSGYLLTLPAWLGDLFLRFDGEGLLARAAICVAIITPAGLLMGFGFPLGMRLVSAFDVRPTPWLWGVNGAAGVLAATLAVAMSITFGIMATILLGAVCYLVLIPAALGIGFRVAAPNVSRND